MATLTAAGLLAGAGIASAHITVNPGTAVAGAYTKLTFRVPTESATAQTTQLTVTFPSDHPFSSVSYRKVPGWTATPTTTTLPTPVTEGDLTITKAVTSITWKADSAADAISQGQFGEFDVSVGPVPNVASLQFPAAQTYSDGSVVNWDEQSSGAEEPEHPAPTLTIAPAAPGAGAGEPATAASPASAASGTAGTQAPDTAAQVTVTAAAADQATSDSSARVLGVVGIVVGALGLLGAVWAIRRGRSA